MLKYLGSRTFFFTIVVFALLLWKFGLNDLSNYVQVSQIFIWSYLIWHLEKHHKLLKELLDDEGEQ